GGDAVWRWRGRAGEAALRLGRRRSRWRSTWRRSSSGALGASPGKPENRLRNRASQEVPSFLGQTSAMSVPDPSNGHRILVVDDEPNIVDVVSMALRYQGFDVETASTGREAISAANTYRPHLMVLDIMLPDMEGFEVARRLGADRSDLPIVFLTARDTTEDKVRGLTSGGDDYVTKPFSLEELVARIRTILRRVGLSDRA